MQIRLLPGDVRNVSGNGQHQFSQAGNVPAKQFLCGGEARKLSVEHFGMSLERFTTCYSSSECLNCFRAGVLNIIAKPVQMIMHVPVIFRECLKAASRFLRECLHAADGFGAPVLDGLVQVCLFTGDIGYVAGHSL